MNTEKCKWLIDEVCCNDKSSERGDFPHPEIFCKKKCPLYEKGEDRHG